jgi:hypothetical protein
MGDIYIYILLVYIYIILYILYYIYITYYISYILYIYIWIFNYFNGFRKPENEVYSWMPVFVTGK